MLVNKNLFYIHIPRTAGRFISHLFIENKFNCEFHQFTNYYDDPLKKLTEVPHLEYPYYGLLYNHEAMTKFSVVRDPVDRFISMLSCTNPTEQNLDNIFENQQTLDEFINYRITKTKSNWFVPQCKFVSHDTKIWNFENGLQDNFFKWIKVNFNIDFKNTEVKYHKVDYDFYNKIELSNKQKDLVKNYYYQDYKVFTL